MSRHRVTPYNSPMSRIYRLSFPRKQKKAGGTIIPRSSSSRRKKLRSRSATGRVCKSGTPARTANICSMSEMFRQPVALPDGRVVDKWVDTSKLNKRQMRDFMDKIQSYMATEHGVAVPLPDDDRYADFKALYS